MKPPDDPAAALAALLEAGRRKVAAADADRVARILAAQQRKLDLIAAALAARSGAPRPGTAADGAPAVGHERESDSESKSDAGGEPPGRAPVSGYSSPKD